MFALYKYVHFNGDFVFQILKKYATQWIMEISDITDFVKEQYQVLHTKGEGHLCTPCEQVYPVSPDVQTQIGSSS